jgi:hypothetical protein
MHYICGLQDQNFFVFGVPWHSKRCTFKQLVSFLIGDDAVISPSLVCIGALQLIARTCACKKLELQSRRTSGQIWDQHQPGARHADQVPFGRWRQSWSKSKGLSLSGHMLPPTASDGRGPHRPTAGENSTAPPRKTLTVQPPATQGDVTAAASGGQSRSGSLQGPILPPGLSTEIPQKSLAISHPPL